MIWVGTFFKAFSGCLTVEEKWDECTTIEEFPPVALFEHVVLSRQESRFVDFVFSLPSLQSINIEY